MRSDIARVREQVARVRQVLLSSGASERLESCISGLETSIRLFAKSRAPEAHEINALRQELLAVAALAATGETFWDTLNRLGKAKIATQPAEESPRIEVRG